MADKENLVVKSKLKEYVKSQGLSCAGDVADVLSEQLRIVVDDAITATKKDKKKTLLSRYLV